MAVKSNQQLLIKIAQINKSARHVLRNRSRQKQAGWFKKKYEKPGWENDEDAVNQLAEDLRFNEIYRYQFPDKVITKALDVYNADPAKADQAINRFNARFRMNRHSDRSAALVDRYFDLWGDNIIPGYNERAHKEDRITALSELRNDIVNFHDSLPEDKQEEAYNLVTDIDKYLDEWYGKDPYKIDSGEVGVYYPSKKKMLKEPLTRTDVGSLADATPKQLKTWNRQARKSPLWETLWPMLVGAGTGAAVGGSIPLKPNESRLGMTLMGLIGGGAMGLLPGVLRGNRIAEEKEHALRRLNET